MTGFRALGEQGDLLDAGLMRVAAPLTNQSQNRFHARLGGQGKRDGMARGGTWPGR
jgi:hypothetical protein